MLMLIKCYHKKAVVVLDTIPHQNAEPYNNRNWKITKRKTFET